MPAEVSIIRGLGFSVRRAISVLGYVFGGILPAPSGGQKSSETAERAFI